jgi:nicotinamide-nucleotide amidase
MLRRVLEGPLAGRTPSTGLFRRVVKVTGRSESHVEEAVQPIYSRWLSGDPPISTTILSAPGQIELHLSVRSDSPASGRAILDAAVAQLTQALGRDIYSSDGRTLEQLVGDLLRAHRLKIATAESCTGGLLASRLTDVPGSSDYVERGVVCYSNASKTELAGVPASLMDEHGAVSEPVAMALAAGIRERARIDIGVGVTGIAGPGGGSEDKPVGTVVVAVAGPGDEMRVRTFRFPGGREQIKWQSTQTALDMVRRRLEMYDA